MVLDMALCVVLDMALCMLLDMALCMVLDMALCVVLDMALCVVLDMALCMVHLQNFEEYPEHRTNFFLLLQAVNSHCFSGYDLCCCSSLG